MLAEDLIPTADPLIRRNKHRQACTERACTYEAYSRHLVKVQPNNG